jgi:anti-sigma B factor antagonist
MRLTGQKMRLIHEIVDGVHVIRVRDCRIDAAAAIRFKDRMRDLSGELLGRCILDLTRVDFIDSSGLGAIVTVMKFLAPTCRLELAAPTPMVDRVFRMTRMDEVFVIHAAAPATGAGIAS